MPQRTESERERLRRISILNARLPKKRTIAQGVLRNPAGEVLLCELSYKKEWDLPGGVVDPGESPATCVEREVEEELGIQVTAGRLLAVNWLPPGRAGGRSRVPRRTSRRTPRGCWRSPTTPSTRPTWRTASRPAAERRTAA